MRGLRNWQLFAVVVAIWGTTWHVITYQIGPISPEVGVALRFGLAGACVLAACALRGTSLRLPGADHARLALQGMLLYGVSYLCVYHAERYVPSGLVAVGFSASPLIVGIGARVAFGAALSRRFVVGGAIGLGGVALIFWPELATTQGDNSAALGAGFTVAAVLLSTTGNLSASRNGVHGLAFWPAMGFGMLYGGAACALLALALGRSFALPVTLSWWLSLAYLALAGSVLAFACFLSLQSRIGPGRAGTVGVMTPIVGLAVSLLLEGFRPSWASFAGVLLALLGNWCILGQAVAPKIAGSSPPPRKPPG
ncbi:MAG: DMT family transporter [Burkholderiaceae bacterium]